MNSSQIIYRELYDSILSEDYESIYHDILAPWQRANTAEQEWMCALAARSSRVIPAVKQEDLWRLYALSRVTELLLLSFQPDTAGTEQWSGPSISEDHYAGFAVSMGLTNTIARQFSPIYHEIVEVEQAEDENQPITLCSTLWPCLMLGDMVFSRAGVKVRGGSRFIQKEIAESSTLYWASRRKNRPVQDLSHGWGSNSQWRTEFRRDFNLPGNGYHYNVDGKHDLNSEKLPKKDDYGLTRAERIELLTHRCFVKTPKPHTDLWPYDDKSVQIMKIKLI